MTQEEFKAAYQMAMGWEDAVVQDGDLPMEYPVCMYRFADGSRVTAVCPEIPLEAVPEACDLAHTLDALFDMDAIKAQYESVSGFYAPDTIQGEELSVIREETLLAELMDALDEKDRLRGEVTPEDDFTACIVENGHMIAAAGAVLESGGFADISLCVHPEMRRRGLGKRVAKTLIKRIQRAGYAPLYRVENSNEASVNLARSIGLRTGFVMDGALLLFPNE